MNAEWYHSSDGKIFGPFDVPTIRSMAQRGILKPTDHLRRGEHGEWILARSTKGLVFGSPVPPVAPAAAWVSCPHCGHRFPFSPAHAGFVVGCPACTGQLQLPSRTAEDEPSKVEPESRTTPENAEKHPLATLAAGVFRIASPTCWCGAIVFFFLPWIEIGCSDDRTAGRELTMSGAQLAWGGGTVRVGGMVTEFQLGAPNKLWDKPRDKAGCVLLNVYFAGLVVCAMPMLFLTPGPTRGMFGFLIGLALLACLLGGCDLLTEGELSSKKFDFLKWYYSSYVANQLAVAFFLLEMCCLSDAPRWKTSRAVRRLHGYG